VYDDQLPTTKIEEATLVFFKDGKQVAQVASDDSGRYQVNLPKGSYKVEASKYGYIVSSRTVDVAGSIQHGQGAEVGLCKVLATGEIRVLLNWGAHSRDLDTWVYFDKNFAKYVSYYKKNNVGSLSGVSVTLDWDSTNGYGPETTTIKGIGKCTQNCLVKYHVDNYTPRDGNLGESDAVVTVYKGDEVAASFNIPAAAGTDRGRTIFTLDAADGKIFEGDFSRGPFVDARNRAMGEVDWSASMDSVGWSKVPPGSVIYAIGANDFSNLHHISAARYYTVQPTGAEFEIHEHAWLSKLHDGDYAGCPDGSWVSGLYREGAKLDHTHTGGWQLTRVQCIRWLDVSAWGACEDVEIFKDGGEGADAARCPIKDDGTALAFVGFYSKAADEFSSLQTLHKGKCCSFPNELVPVPEDKQCHKKQFCHGMWNANP
jgi:hypothetical protein